MKRLAVIFNVLFVFGGNMKFDARVVLMLVLGGLAAGVGHSAEIDASVAGINSVSGEGSNIALKLKWQLLDSRTKLNRLLPSYLTNLATVLVSKLQISLAQDSPPRVNS